MTHYIKPALGFLTGCIFYLLMNYTSLPELDKNFVGFILMFPLVALQIKLPEKNIFWWALALLIPFTLIYGLSGHHVATVAATFKPYTGPRATYQALLYQCMVSGFIVFVFYCTAIQEKRWSFPYHTLFQESWLILLKVFFGLIFIPLVMGFFYLISSLFKLINIMIVDDFVRSTLFHQVMFPFLFGVSLMIMDNKEELIQKNRGFLLAICKFLYPIFVVVSIDFLAILPFSHQSFDQIWSFSIVFSSLNILLFNGIFQDGSKSAPYPAWMCRLIYVAMFLITIYAIAVIPYPWSQMNQSQANVGLLILLEIVAIFLALYQFSYCISIVFSKKPWLSLVKTSNKVIAIVIAMTYLLLTIPHFMPQRVLSHSERDAMSSISFTTTESKQSSTRYLRLLSATV